LSGKVDVLCCAVLFHLATKKGELVWGGLARDGDAACMQVSFRPLLFLLRGALCCALFAVLELFSYTGSKSPED
jgi:hypothetical protein